MLSNTNILKIENLCFSVVATYFAIFCNKDNQGANFKWEKFPELVVRRVMIQIDLSNFSNSQQDKIKEYAEHVALKLATEMIKEAGFTILDQKVN